MKAQYLFTKSNKIGSILIRLITGEDESHVGIFVNGRVYHSTAMKGPHSQTYREFMKGKKLVDSVDYRIDELPLDQGGRGFYDFLSILYWAGALFYSRITNSELPKKNLFQYSDHYICTEYGLEAMGEDPSLMISPGKLKRLLKERISK